MVSEDTIMINKLEPLEDQQVSDAEGSSSGEAKFQFSRGEAQAAKKKNKKKSPKKKMGPIGYSK